MPASTAPLPAGHSSTETTTPDRPAGRNRPALPGRAALVAPVLRVRGIGRARDPRRAGRTHHRDEQRGRCRARRAPALLQGWGRKLVGDTLLAIARGELAMR